MITLYNSNTYNPSAGIHYERRIIMKRKIIIDGSNVAFRWINICIFFLFPFILTKPLVLSLFLSRCSHSLNKNFSVKGLQIALDYFEKMGHDVKAVLPQFRLSHARSTDPKQLQILHSLGKIVLTPCKWILGKGMQCYDDRYRIFSISYRIFSKLFAFF